MNNIKITWRGCFVWALASLFFFYQYFARTILAPLNELITHDLHINSGQLAFIVSVAYLAYAVMQIPVGYLIDKFGARIVLTVAMFFCAIGNLYFSHASLYLDALLSFTLIGVGGSAAFIGLLHLSIKWFPARVIGLMAGLTQLLGMCGPIIAGKPLACLMSSNHNNWQEVAFYTGIFGLGLAVVFALFIRNAPQKDASEHQPKRHIWQDLKVLCKNKDMMLIALYAFMVYPAVPTIGALWGVRYIETLGYSMTEAAAMNSVLWLGMGIGSPLVGILSDWLQMRRAILSLIALIGALLMVLLLWYPLDTLGLEVVIFLIGATSGGHTLSFAALADRVEPALSSTAIGINNTSVMLGAATAQAVTGEFFEIMQPHSSIATTFIWTLAPLAAFYVIAFVVATWGIKDIRQHG